jgi:hypothetical protein
MDKMKWARLRLGLAVILFVGWLGWLVYLAATAAPRSETLSKSQLLVSNLDVVAQIDALDGKIKIEKVRWPHTKQADALAGAIEVRNLPSCDGWKGPGRYIVPLITNWHGSYEVAPLPPTPGFESARPRIYPDTPDTLKQLDEFDRSSKPEADLPVNQ